MCRERAAPPFCSCCPLVAPGLQSQCSRWVNVMCSVGCQLSHPLSLWERGKGDEINAELVCCINAPLTQQTNYSYVVYPLYVCLYIHLCKANSGWGRPAACNPNKGLSSDGWMTNAVRCRQCCGYWFLSVSTSLPCPKALLLMVPPLDF